MEEMQFPVGVFDSTRIGIPDRTSKKTYPYERAKRLVRLARYYGIQAYIDNR